MKRLIIIFVCILAVFLLSRLISFMVLEWNILPENTFVTLNGFRLHHFVYGNFLILITSFLVIALKVRPDSNAITFLYGIGLGLVLDEFPHWVGSVKELTRNVPIIPGAIPVVVGAELAILILILLKYFKII